MKGDGLCGPNGHLVVIGLHRDTLGMVPEATPHCEIRLATGQLGDVKDSGFYISGNS